MSEGDLRPAGYLAYRRAKAEVDHLVLAVGLVWAVALLLTLSVRGRVRLLNDRVAALSAALEQAPALEQRLADLRRLEGEVKARQSRLSLAAGTAPGEELDEVLRAPDGVEIETAAWKAGGLLEVRGEAGRLWQVAKYMHQLEASSGLDRVVLREAATDERGMVAFHIEAAFSGAKAGRER